ncbi:hypothetical protein HBI56_017140 [Parastagonospora nodorum]|uniref:Uncharacterized protein n=2 Tax=Phaeosphaeria nodorum (strain SN15 / ATCC MYA-4574 / FGSC 10173) TaxID=321614 RepID=A0A7U2I004_PHANO|nr:hypothetical protein SNOG_01590 [Parastagonospora nodorum SN15]KAH3914978.1 hypothetical protein HBH56_082860 [Parastagonospora nodorum]EAT91239.1 hypothetical protein SNOG_01590 [Parastagonospora nodorum SN15]KAH3929784.1 hypothetical protein HBH54_118970 [Parastagonospora nodorum]KAH3955474.1 hypothetical protein HBH53_005590 [Parastagonospora nodorum]KAH3976836.1 hypothetical protein HBH51_075920 [Parastagonospora nodorum]
MCQNLELKTQSAGLASGLRLTEENLRLHSAVNKKMPPQIMLQNHQLAEKEFHYNFNMDYEESEDGDLLAMHDLALRQAVSLEALQAYGGCFVSGFLAMQETPPWASSPTATTYSGTSSTSTGSPRPDSQTLSREDLRDLSGKSKKSWKGLKKIRSIARLSKN